VNRPTIQELARGYTSVGITLRNAVFYIVDSHMRAAIARGKGNRARRRTQLVKFGPTVRFALRPADVEAERFSEGRRHNTAPRTNPHD
jgi:hypothetical protein